MAHAGSVLALLAGPAMGQFKWDGSCADPEGNWHFCCDRGQLKDNNWELEPQPQCPPFPGPFDDVDLNGAAVRLVDRPAAIKSLMHGHLILFKPLDVEESVMLDRLTLNNQLTLGGSLTVTGQWDWQGGHLIGPEGSEAFANDRLRMFGTGHKVITDRKVVCRGAATWADSGRIQLNGGAIENQVSFTFDNASFIEGAGRFINKGMFSKTVNPGETRVAGGLIPFENAESGTIDVQVGTLFLEGGGESRGAISVAQDAVLRINTQNPAAPFTFKGNTQITGDGSVVISGNGVKADQGVQVGAMNARLLGALHGPGRFAFTNLEWEGGTIQAEAGVFVNQLTLEPLFSHLVVSGAALTSNLGAWGDIGLLRLVIADDGAFINADRFQITGRPKTVEIIHGPDQQSSWIIDQNGKLDVQANVTFGPAPGAAGTMINLNEMNFDTALCVFGTTRLLQNRTLNVRSGEVRVAGGGASAGGAFNIAQGAKLTIQSQPYQVRGANFTGDGLLRIGPSGTLDVSAGGPTTARNVEMELTGSATLTGDGELQVSGNLDWLAGRMTGTGKTTVQGTAEISTPANHTLVQRTLRNEGTMRWLGGHILVEDGAVLHNASAGIVDVETTDDFRHTAGAEGKIENEGIFRKLSGGETLTIPAGVRFDNEEGGVVNLQSGDMTIAGGGTSKGVFSVAADSAVDFKSNDYTLAGDARIQGMGRGRLNRAGARLAITGSDVQIQNLELIDGILEGPGRLTVTQTLDWHAAGSMHGPAGGTTVMTGATNIIGAGLRTIDERTVINLGRVNWQEGSLALKSASVLQNQGTLDIQGDVLLDGDGRFLNSGTLIKSLREGRPGSADIQANFVHTGRAEVQTGHLLLHLGESLGQFHVASDATLDFLGGPFTLGAGTAITGPGATTLVGGTLIVGDFVTAERFDVFSGALSGAGDLIVQRFGWNGGTMSGSGATIVERASMTLQRERSLDGRRLEILAAADWEDGDIRAVNGAVLRNRGVFTMESFRNRIMYGGSALFDNLGAVVLNVPKATTVTIDVGFRNGGLIALPGLGTLRFTHDFVQVGGAISAGPGRLEFARELSFQGGRIGGNGLTLFGNIRNTGGRTAPGRSSGALTLDGDYVQERGGTMEIELGGLVPDVEHDVLVVTGDAALGGTMEILLIDGFEPQVGDRFTVMTYGSHSGEFDRVIPPCGYEFAVHYNANDVTLEVTGVGVLRPGDLDGDCDIDLDDYKRVAPCIGGPGVEVPPQGCDPDDFIAADLDDDFDVDVKDVRDLFNLFAPS
ncbi:MAG: hypothetical protein C4547_04890 [Phycisphaerales bacterium]|nr:MAG: hypothetical protein C4547_04890 [Phycisphaerales bacterium]